MITIKYGNTFFGYHDAAKLRISDAMAVVVDDGNVDGHGSDVVSESILSLDNVVKTDAGTYICEVDTFVINFDLEVVEKASAANLEAAGAAGRYQGKAVAAVPGRDQGKAEAVRPVNLSSGCSNNSCFCLLLLVSILFFSVTKCTL